LAPHPERTFADQLGHTGSAVLQLAMEMDAAAR
jgi:hypothetical protein